MLTQLCGRLFGIVWFQFQCQFAYWLLTPQNHVYNHDAGWHWPSPMNNTQEIKKKIRHIQTRYVVLGLYRVRIKC